MAHDYSARKFRSAFTAEKQRIADALVECDELETSLSAMLTELQTSIRRDRAAASLFVRLTEQRISNRGQRASLLKLLTDLQRSVLDRELKLAQAADAADGTGGTAGMTPGDIAYFQGVLLGPGSTLLVLEPPPPQPAQPPTPPKEAPLPTVVSSGDIVCVADGSLFVVHDDRIEDLQMKAAQVVMSTDDTPSYAAMEDGRRVLVVEFDDEPA